MRRRRRALEWGVHPVSRPQFHPVNVMSSEGSVTRWVTALKGGDTAAAQPLWERYHRQLVSLARQKLQSARVPEAGSRQSNQKSRLICQARRL